MRKLKYLDGIRGLMTLNVIICHFVCVYYPQMYSEAWKCMGGGGRLSMFATTPLSIFVNGNIAVQYFFVLTGFLVGRACFLSNDLSGNDILKKSVNRYIRLLPVCVMATLFTVLTMVLGVQYHLDIVDLAWNGSFMNDYCNFQPTISSVAKNLLISPFLKGSSYIGPFWTIKYELWGYIFTMLAAMVLKKSKLRRLAYVVIAVLFIIMLDSNYCGFIAGLFVADLVYRRESKTTILSGMYERWVYGKISLVVLALIGLYCASCPIQFSGVHVSLAHLPLINESIVRAVGCSILIFCLTQTKHFYKIFETAPLMFLGKLSFAIYAFHWPLMLSLEAWLFKMFVSKMSYHFATVSSLFITVIGVILVACLVSRIEKKLDWNANRLIDRTTISEKN